MITTEERNKIAADRINAYCERLSNIAKAFKTSPSQDWARFPDKFEQRVKDLINTVSYIPKPVFPNIKTEGGD